MDDIITGIYIAYDHIWKDKRKQIKDLYMNYEHDTPCFQITVNMRNRNKLDVITFKRIAEKFLKSRKVEYTTTQHGNDYIISMPDINGVFEMKHKDLKESIKAEIRKSLKEANPDDTISPDEEVLIEKYIKTSSAKLEQIFSDSKQFAYKVGSSWRAPGYSHLMKKAFLNILNKHLG